MFRVVLISALVLRMGLGAREPSLQLPLDPKGRTLLSSEAASAHVHAAAELPDLPAEYARAVEASWTAWHHSLARLQVTGVPLNSHVLNQLLHRWAITRHMYKLGVAYRGSEARLRRVMHDVMAGRPIKVGVVGGSVSLTFDPLSPSDHTYFAAACRWLRQMNNNTQCRNGAVGGTPSAYGYLCLSQLLDMDADLVFVEYAMNDGYTLDRPSKFALTYEQLLRRLLSLPHKPAVVLVQVASGTYPGQNDFHRFDQLAEEHYASLAQLYDVPQVSLRNALWQVCMTREYKLDYKMFYQDDFAHPNKYGHQVMGDLVVGLLQSAALNLLEEVFTPDERQRAAAALPEPLYPGNYHTDKKVCVRGAGLAPYLRNLNGFMLVNEGTPQKPKRGWRATQPGSSLQLVVGLEGHVVNTQAAQAVLREDERGVTLHIGFLESYERMGVAEIKCVTGCTCQPATLNANGTRDVSQMHFELLKLDSYTQTCTLNLTLLATTHSGGHKFRLDALVVGDGFYSEGITGAVGTKGLVLNPDL